MKAIASENHKRGNPIHHTQWEVDDIKKYTKWQMKLFKDGILKQDDLGGFSWKLPASRDHHKAPFPEEMKMYLKTGKVQMPVP